MSCTFFSVYFAQFYNILTIRNFILENNTFQLTYPELGNDYADSIGKNS